MKYDISLTLKLIEKNMTKTVQCVSFLCILQCFTAYFCKNQSIFLIITLTQVKVYLIIYSLYIILY